ncbi:MAG: hypothetical protein C5B58_04360 [Acidobacteria bacterium]|nr:MAG: hypothetical protein C5B58_04360 [Acidobacteriota bacterium]
MTSSPDYSIRKVLAAALVFLPCAYILVFVMHFRQPGDFFHFRTHYVQAPPERVVAALIAMHNRYPLIHDPHVIGYLSLPLFVLCAFALYLIGRNVRPLASAAALMITISGTIYLGGVFGMWTAFYRGLGLVDPQYIAGATATFAAMTTPQGAFLMTTSLAKLTMIGLALQALALIGARVTPWWSVLCVVAGCTLFLLFWDLDNWMLIGMILMLIGFLPMRRVLLQEGKATSAAGGNAG